jgi:hypothetical protein
METEDEQNRDSAQTVDDLGSGFDVLLHRSAFRPGAALSIARTALAP